MMRFPIICESGPELGSPRDDAPILTKIINRPLAQGVYIQRYYQKACLQQLDTNTAAQCHTVTAS